MWFSLPLIARNINFVGLRLLSESLSTLMAFKGFVFKRGKLVRPYFC